ncbi:lipoprotein NlpI [Colwellia sp. 4_MG-2023]|uniref:lipoprotein NlpI n=1 Tax=unclassified Colwellia TaxID=196834 RepID=UPI0026E1235C|nr:MULTISPECIES: lipoprotein NlpI [unclassified Colwellia]MDO6508711.1 lipoprotein NlpI [Colwellia sp. 5_MG-2023]MDO6557387.1 lipoprotein NlpI [Colwellia sp. 4_MG-2023]
MNLSFTEFKSKLLILAIVSCMVLLTQGCSSLGNANNSLNSSSINQLVIAEPLAINFKSEIAIARLSEVLNRVKITDEQKAQIHYDRGVLFDSVGLRSLARLDFSQALQLKPNLIDAYNFLGIHFTQLREFSQAYEQFDSVLELAPEHEYAHLNRGIALYYGGRPSLAAQDFTDFHYQQNDDPYRLLWLYLAEHNVDPVSAKSMLRERSSLVDDRTWAKQVIHLYLGDISQAQFVSELTRNIQSNKALTDRLCEAYFYLGKYNQIMGFDGAAANFFKLSLSTNVYEFVEHRYAKLELDLMRSANSTAVEEDEL